MSNIRDIGNNINKYYSQLTTSDAGNISNFNIYQSNDNSMQTVVNNLNGKLADANNSASLLGLLSNINQENIVKADQYIKLQNDDLTEQLRNLESIQSNIENKNRIIEQINYNMDKQQRNMNILIVSLVFGIILLSSLIAYGYNYINFSQFIYIIIVLIVLYTIYIIYQYNIFYVNSALKALFTNNIPNRLSTAVSDLQSTIQNQIEYDMYGPEAEWVEQNCSCPASVNTPPVYANIGSEVYEETPGHYYYDQSAPPQLLVPTPNIPTLNNSIQWVDYDTLQDNSTTYYNYNTNNTDPNIVLRNQLNSSKTNLFVGSETMTGNV